MSLKFTALMHFSLKRNTVCYIANVMLPGLYGVVNLSDDVILVPSYTHTNTLLRFY